MDEKLKKKYWKLSGFASSIEVFLWVVLVVALIGSVVIGFTVTTEDSYGRSQPNFVLAAVSAICSAIAIVPVIAVMRAIHVWSLEKSDGYSPPSFITGPSSVHTSPSNPRTQPMMGMDWQGFPVPIDIDASGPAREAGDEEPATESGASWKISDDPDDPKIVL